MTELCRDGEEIVVRSRRLGSPADVMGSPCRSAKEPPCFQVLALVQQQCPEAEQRPDALRRIIRSECELKSTCVPDACAIREARTSAGLSRKRRERGVKGLCLCCCLGELRRRSEHGARGRPLRDGAAGSGNLFRRRASGRVAEGGEEGEGLDQLRSMTTSGFIPCFGSRSRSARKRGSEFRRSVDPGKNTSNGQPECFGELVRALQQNQPPFRLVDRPQPPSGKRWDCMGAALQLARGVLLRHEEKRWLT